MKILILKPSSLGDVVQALPVLRLIKRHLPASDVYWWIDSSLAPLIEGDPDLAGVVRFERRRWASPVNWLEMWQSVRWMRAQKFDWVIDLQCLARSGAFAWLANGQLTVGLDDPREGARGYYDLIAPRKSWTTHAVDWYLGVLPLLSVPIHNDFTWLPERQQVAAAVRAKWSTGTAQWIVILPGARWANKRWPVEYFTELVQRLTADYPNVRFAILGSPTDKPLGMEISRATPQRCLDLTGETSLSEMVEWIRLCMLVVSNDTGPLHVAAALGRPVVAMFGPTEPRRTGPYGQISRALQTQLTCVPCMKSVCSNKEPMECLRSISPAAVTLQLSNLLAAQE